MDILHRAPRSSDIRESSFVVIASASTGNEVVKESFMELKVDQLLVEAVKEESNNNMQSLYDAIRVILTPDDPRVAASQVIAFIISCYAPVILKKCQSNLIYMPVFQVASIWICCVEKVEEQTNKSAKISCNMINLGNLLT